MAATTTSHTPRSSLAMDTTLKSRDQLIPRLPLELERDIFELTARIHRETAVQLTLVARRVQIWVERVIYQVISLSSHKKCSHFLKTLESRPKAFFQSHVKAICLPYYLDIEQATRILAVCGNVENLACWACRPPPPLPQTQASLPLSAMLIGAAVGGIAAGKAGSTSLYQCLMGLGHESKTNPKISNGDGTAARPSNGGRDEHNPPSRLDSTSNQGEHERGRWEWNPVSPTSSQPASANGSSLYSHESLDNDHYSTVKAVPIEEDGEEDMVPRPRRLSINIGELFQPATLPRPTPLPIPGNQLLTNIPTTPTHLQINIHSNVGLAAGAATVASASTNDNSYPDFTLPLFCKLTHLRIIDGWTSWITFCHLLYKVPKLTHLALDCSGLMVGVGVGVGAGAGGTGMQGIERVLGGVRGILGLRLPEDDQTNDSNASMDPTPDADPNPLGTCSNLKILILSINRFEKPEIRRALEALTEEDERVVVMDYENPMVNWQKGVGVKPGVCQWTLAEGIVEERRKCD